MRREKRTAPTTVHFRPTLRQAIELAANAEQRTLSTIISRLAERDPTIQLFIQKVERQVGTN